MAKEKKVYTWEVNCGSPVDYVITFEISAQSWELYISNNNMIGLSFKNTKLLTNPWRDVLSIVSQFTSYRVA